ncbi:hypothetical protein AX16_003900 [Volvariella volvacea WC 439]|nr:hypothetical protein AX16_003900 [Volvariella volvacea WC 439]
MDSTTDSPDTSQIFVEPSVYVEPEVADPFLIDEDDEEANSVAASAAPKSASPTGTSQEDLPPESSSLGSLSPQVPTPPPLGSADMEGPEVESREALEQQFDNLEEEIPMPDIDLPGLVIPTMFFPIPNTDPLTTLLTKYIYPPDKRPVRDLTGDWKNEDHQTLVVTNSWRALAKKARDILVTSNPDEVGHVLNLWYLRLSSLARLRLFNQTSAECTNLFTVLNSAEPASTKDYIFEHLVPFELEVLHARVKYWAGDHMGYLDALYKLLRRCRIKARECFRVAQREEREYREWEIRELEGHVHRGSIRKKKPKGIDWVSVEMWKERGARMCLILASHLIEMKDLAAAVKLLEPLCSNPTTSFENMNDPASPMVQIPSSPYMHSAIARIYLQAGVLDKAKWHFDKAEEKIFGTSAGSKDSVLGSTTEENTNVQESNAPEVDQQLIGMNKALFACANGRWDDAVRLLKEEVIARKGGENYAAINNLAVALLSKGELKEAIDILESALANSPSTVVTAEPFLFNLATLYELRSSSSLEQKKKLLVEVAKWSGDGLRTACLKMPTT